jgi:lactate dehydrogenase-like 2-hydroxyacid dehydrogenase
MTIEGICLRPAKDFQRARIIIPDSLNMEFFVPESENQIIERGRDVDFIIAPSHNVVIGEKIFSGFNNLKVVQLCGSGFDNVDLDAAARYGVPVAHAPDQNSKTVAEYVFIMTGVISRRLLEGNNLVKQGKFAAARKELITPTLHEFGGQNLGIIGIGMIGREVARIGNFFGFHVGYFDIEKLTPDMEDKLGVNYYEFTDILEWADIITLHVPFDASTKSLIGEKELQAMKSSAILIDISRGGITDEYALSKALTEGQIWGAGMDVFSEEPPPDTHPYFKLSPKVQDRLLLSSHMGGRTIESNQRMFGFAIENVRAFLADGKPLECIINL